MKAFVVIRHGRSDIPNSAGYAAVLGTIYDPEWFRLYSDTQSYRLMNTSAVMDRAPNPLGTSTKRSRSKGLAHRAELRTILQSRYPIWWLSRHAIAAYGIRDHAINETPSSIGWYAPFLPAIFNPAR